MSKGTSLLFVIVIIVFLVSFMCNFCVFSFSSNGITGDRWVSKEPMHQARSGLGVAVVKGKIYAIGGATNEGFCATTEEYDPETNIWTFKKPMPTARSAFGIAVFQDKIYCIGGYTSFASAPATGVNEVYDPSTDMWESKSPMPTPRINARANIVTGKIYVIGGIPNGTVNEVYDPATDTWATKSSAPTPVSSYASAVVNNKIYVITSNITLIYDVENDRWSYGLPPPSHVILASAGATTGIFAPKRIYVFGADADTPYWQLTLRNFTTLSYDPKTNSWNVCASMPTGRFDAGVAVVNDRLYVIGGFTTQFRSDKFTINPLITYLATNEQYTPEQYEQHLPESIPMWIVVSIATTATATAFLHLLPKIRKNPKLIAK